MQLITRAEWGARPRGQGTTSIDPEGCAVHYEGEGWAWPWAHSTCASKVRAIQDFHMDGRGWSDIAYNFLACPHGYVFEGRGLNRRSSANGNESVNASWYAVQCMWGTKSGSAPAALLEAARDAIDYCRAKGGAGNALRGHRDFKATDCPGDQLYAWAHAGAPRPNIPIPTEDDMTPEQEKQLAEAHARATFAYDAVREGGGTDGRLDTLEGRVTDTTNARAQYAYKAVTEGGTVDARLDDLKAALANIPLPPPDASAEARLAAVEAILARFKEALA